MNHSTTPTNGHPARAPGKVRFMPDPDPDPKTPGPVLLNMADVKAEPVRWLWPGRVAVGCLTLIVGAPGNGKSFATIDLAARVTSGRAWPDGAACGVGGVVLVSPEDNPGETIRPRLEAAGADLARVTLIDGVKVTGGNGRIVERGYSLADLAHTTTAIDATPDCRLLVIDPVGSVMGGEVDGHRDNEVRGVLAPLAKLARDRSIAVILVLHTRKSGGGTADDRALGSRGFVGIARAVHHVILESNDPDPRRFFLPGKINVGRKPPGLAFRISGEPAAVIWELEPVTLSADKAYRLADDHGEDTDDNGDELEAAASALQEAECVLARLLIDGPRRCGERSNPEPGTIRAESRDAGVSERTLQRAKGKLRAIAFRDGDVWHWRLLKDGDGRCLLPEQVRQVLADDDENASAPRAESLAHLAHSNLDTGYAARSRPCKKQVRQERHTPEHVAETGAETAKPPRTPAADWLAATLTVEPKAVADLRRLAKDAGVSWHKLSRAADALAVVFVPAAGEAPARWRLPDVATLERDGSGDAA